MKTAEELLCDYIPIHTPGTLSDIAKDLKQLEDQGLLVQVSGNYKLKDLLVFPLRFSRDVDMTFKTVPGNSIYTLSCETDKGLGGEFKKS